MESVMFLISLYGENIVNGEMPIGVADSNNKNIIAKFIKNKFDLKLEEQTSNTFYRKNGIHYEYKTNDSKVFVHVNVISKIE